MGLLDRGIRFLLGLILLVLAWYWSSWILLFFALFCFYEAYASWCVMYHIIGRNTCAYDRDKK